MQPQDCSLVPSNLCKHLYIVLITIIQCAFNADFPTGAACYYFKQIRYLVV